MIVMQPVALRGLFVTSKKNTTMDLSKLTFPALLEVANQLQSSNTELDQRVQHLAQTVVNHKKEIEDLETKNEELHDKLETLAPTTVLDELKEAEIKKLRQLPLDQLESLTTNLPEVF